MQEVVIAWRQAYVTWHGNVFLSWASLPQQTHCNRPRSDISPPSSQHSSVTRRVRNTENRPCQMHMS
jgi:hypothetical protein